MKFKKYNNEQPLPYVLTYHKNRTIHRNIEDNINLKIKIE